MSSTKQPDWAQVEADYRAGVKSLRQVAAENSITEGAIRKRAKKEEWPRDLSAKIRAKAEEMVRKGAVRNEERAECVPSEREIVQVNATLQANLIREHRRDIQRHRVLVSKMVEQLEAETGETEAFREIGELLAKPDDKGVDKLNDAYLKAISLPQRIDGVKKLAETLKILLGLERQAFGLADNAEGDKPPEEKQEAGSLLDAARRIAFTLAQGAAAAKKGKP